MGTKTIIGILAAAIICLAVLIYFAPSFITGRPGSFNQVRTKISIGQSQQTIRELLGPPDEIINSVKRDRYIWGPEESFWDKIPIGAKLEVWRYEFSDGGLNLYFVNESRELDYIAFAPKGVVYEAQ
jgi:hypothetical protein